MSGKPVKSQDLSTGDVVHVATSNGIYLDAVFHNDGYHQMWFVSSSGEERALYREDKVYLVEKAPSPSYSAGQCLKISKVFDDSFDVPVKAIVIGESPLTGHTLVVLAPTTLESRSILDNLGHWGMPFRIKDVTVLGPWTDLAHNHGIDPSCREYSVNGTTVGQCLIKPKVV